MSEMNVSLQGLRAGANQLLETINSTRPHVDRLIDEAAHVDVIEYVKGKMVEGVQLGITSKFSAPGKYRRNMKNLRRALSTMDAVDGEVQKLLLDSDFQDNLNQDNLTADGGVDAVVPGSSPGTPHHQQPGNSEEDAESDIVPLSKEDNEPDVNDDLFDKLDRLMDDINTSVADIDIEVSVATNACT